MRYQFLNKPNPIRGIINRSAMLATVVMFCLMLLSDWANAQGVVPNGISVTTASSTQHAAEAGFTGLPAVLPAGSGIIVSRGVVAQGSTKVDIQGALDGCATPCGGYKVTFTGNQVVQANASVTGPGTSLNVPLRAEGATNARLVMNITVAGRP